MGFAQRLVKSLAYRMGYSVKRLRPAPPARDGVVEGGVPADEIACRLHKVDPYEGFDYGGYEYDPSGWGSQSPAFRKLIGERADRLGLIVEVGTWKGGSAIEMADALEGAGSEAKILCIDTWLGALEFWTDLDDPERHGGLALKNGYPSVYYQFLANVCHRGHQGRVVPFPQTSATAALWLRANGVRADLIYIDGSHEEEGVYADLCDYWDLVAPGGVLFGDDWGWDGVRMAVQRFARENLLDIRHESDKWVLDHREL